MITLESFNFERCIMTIATSRSLQGVRIAIGMAVLSACVLQSATAANVLIAVNQPGVYGRVNISEPLPAVAWVNPQPVIYAPAQYNVQRQPIYLYVPAAHSGNWGRYCGRYNACAQPVVFVQERWVRDRHAQYQYQYQQGHQHGRDRDHDGIRNSRDHDRDGDGVRNSRDRQPNNPYRR